ncbi:MAG TPA: carboxylesterase/lipase family protein [Stellaceae bacterium]|nr:carboxylesterase/lipase family protein [Stellaceae bacterium]
MSDAVVAQTEFGRVKGAVCGSVAAFKGIPYAAAPARFMAPGPPEIWTGNRDAAAYGVRAMQSEGGFAMPQALRDLFTPQEPEPIGEACQVLNVWTPGIGDGRARPAMVWLHGGAFIVGSGGSPWYDGTHLARRGDVVVVTLNHRLGAFGYLDLSDVGGETYGASGNAGMLDIVAALRWVRENIAAFGGDPGNVTLFGQSGGGAKICVLMAMPAAQGLFHKAIIQSGPAVEVMTPANAGETARKVVAAAGLRPDDVEALQSLPPERLLAAQEAVLASIAALPFAERRRHGFNPVVDGRHLPRQPFAPTAPALSATIPMIIGTTADDMNLFFGLAPWAESLDWEGLPDLARGFLGDRAPELVDAYRRARPGAMPRELMLAIMTDQSIRVPSLVIAERKAAQPAPVYAYRFDWKSPELGGRLGACHTLEIPFVFDNLASSRLVGDAPGRGALAAAMSDAWIRFARTGEPNHDGLPDWPRYTAENRATMIFDAECRVEDDPERAERLAWAA